MLPCRTARRCCPYSSSRYQARHSGRHKSGSAATNRSWALRSARHSWVRRSWPRRSSATGTPRPRGPVRRRRQTAWIARCAARWRSTHRRATVRRRNQTAWILRAAVRAQRPPAHPEQPRPFPAAPAHSVRTHRSSEPREPLLRRCRSGRDGRSSRTTARLRLCPESLRDSAKLRGTFDLPQPQHSARRTGRPRAQRRPRASQQRTRRAKGRALPAPANSVPMTAPAGRSRRSADSRGSRALGSPGGC